MPPSIASFTKDDFDFTLPVGRGAKIIRLAPKFLDAVNRDIKNIVAVRHIGELGLGSFKELVEPPQLLVSALHPSTNLAKGSPLLLKQCRVMLSAIKLRAVGDEYKDVVQAVHEMEQLIGCVPELNERIILPDLKHMPVTYHENPRGQSLEWKWSHMPWKNPSRTPPQGSHEKLEFYEQNIEGAGKMRSVRLALLERDPSFVSHSGRDYALCHFMCDFEPMAHIEADHGYSSSHIAAAQMELVAAMQQDPMLCDKIVSSPANSADGILEYEYKSKGEPKAKRAKSVEDDFIREGRYFVRGKDGEVWGNKLFFQDYHNCLENCWFLSREANLNEKGAREFEAWLQANPDYDGLFEVKLSKDNPVNKRKIIPTDSIGKPLTHVAREYFQEKYQHKIRAMGYVAKNFGKRCC